MWSIFLGFGLGAVLAAFLVRLVEGRMSRARVFCSGCGDQIAPTWHALVQPEGLFCDEACYRERPAIIRKAETPARLLRPWYSLRRRHDADA